ncbi:transmembrane protease serine 9-like isoform X2 [Paramacrobiotus metropolitanus]|uniref:transmembrane protease serine 9-like isoform X2 n=1 Tax=Paramacrobiotus metropolitanus TaxID=2943436 RepID=UPI0024463EC6|nr:transmembrane protease serine 9-like isoform X2 [Paramacrobiotus metropolitanus]
MVFHWGLVILLTVSFKQIDAIAGGKVTSRHEIPFMIAIIFESGENQMKVESGGFLLSRNYAITSAHVCKFCERRTCRALIGAWDVQEKNDPTAKIVDFPGRTVNPLYNPDTTIGVVYDASLLKFSQPLDLNEHVQPLCFATPATREIANKDKCHVYGWGNTSLPGQRVHHRSSENFDPDIIAISPKLKKIKTQIMDKVVCDSQIPISGFVCAYTPRLTGPSNGDSGAPLVCKSKDKFYYAYGVYKGLYGSGFEHPPSLYADSMIIYEWVRSIVGNDLNTDCTTDEEEYS